MPLMPLMTYVKLEVGSVPTSSGAPTALPTTRFAGWYAVAAGIIGQQYQLELVSQRTDADGSTASITDTRRAVAKSASVGGNVLSVQFADIDLAALQAVYPSKSFTVADFADLFADHVGRPITDGIGQLVKLTGAWIKKSGGQWRYAFCESRGGISYTVQSIYRSTSADQVGSIVPSSEYIVSTTTGASTGVVVVDVIFTREQVAQGGAPYFMRADILASAGSGTTDERLATREIARLLGIAGVTVNAASFTTAHTYADQEVMLIDAGYTQQRTLKAIIEDHLFVARAVIRRGAVNDWVIVQDKPTAVAAAFIERADGVEVEGLDYRDKPASVSLYYKPQASGGEEWHAVPRTRATGGLLPAKRYQSPYVRAAATADRLCDYLSKRDSIQVHATVSAHAVQLEVREVITIEASVAWSGTRSWMIERIARPADKNVLSMRQYDSTVYTYTSASLPSDATSDYLPDYSQTAPAAPTSLTYVGGSSGVAMTTDGAWLAYAKFTCVPPTVAASFARILFSAIDTTGAIAIQEGNLNGGVYECIFASLRTGVLYTITAQAFSASGTEGAVASITQTTPGNVATLSTPSYVAPGWQNIPGKAIRVFWGGVSLADLREYVVEGRNETSAGSGVYGAWVECFRGQATTFVDNAIEFLRLRQWRAASLDWSGNQSAWATLGTAIISQNITDTELSPGGVSNVSLATSTITRDRLKSTTGSFSSSFGAGVAANVELDTYCFAPSITADSGADVVVKAATSSSGATDRARFRLQNNGGSTVTAGADYRYIQS